MRTRFPSRSLPGSGALGEGEPIRQTSDSDLQPLGADHFMANCLFRRTLNGLVEGKTDGLDLQRLLSRLLAEKRTLNNVIKQGNCAVIGGTYHHAGWEEASVDNVSPRILRNSISPTLRLRKKLIHEP